MPPSRRSSTTTNTTTTCAISSSSPPDDLRENQRRLSPSALHSVSRPSSKLLHTHGYHRSIPSGLVLQSRRHRPRVRPGHRNEDRHRPAQAPSQKAPSPRPRPPPLSHPSTRPPPRLVARHLDDSTVYHKILWGNRQRPNKIQLSSFLFLRSPRETREPHTGARRAGGRQQLDAHFREVESACAGQPDQIVTR
jgi:hypothetical protein